MKSIENVHVAVVGLGYVGLPLAVAFAEMYPVIGFDINPARVAELASGYDSTLEVTDDELRSAQSLIFTADANRIKEANVFVVTTPTPVNEHKQPDLGPVLAASQSIGKVLKPGDTVVYESTVYPGATEEDCVPVLERFSGLKVNQDFSVGYSPERINPGDKEHRVTSILKVTSGSTPEAATFIDRLYSSIIRAGTYMAPSIRVAEAAKVIENTQRDVNIALVNELAVLFNRLGIDTHEVLEAAGTKWNFLKFQPGLVGGHCIGVDPYYLTHKAQAVGYHPEIILAGRRLNDSMGRYVASELVKRLAKNGLQVQGAKVLILGLTFKENTPDLRNTRVVDIVEELVDFDIDVAVHDPWADPEVAQRLYNINLVTEIDESAYDGVVLAVGHSQYASLESANLRSMLRTDCGVIYDLKAFLPTSAIDMRL